MRNASSLWIFAGDPPQAGIKGNIAAHSGGAAPEPLAAWLLGPVQADSSFCSEG
jgi:hypothetical protein